MVQDTSDTPRTLIKNLAASLPLDDVTITGPVRRKSATIGGLLTTTPSSRIASRLSSTTSSGSKSLQQIITGSNSHNGKLANRRSLTSTGWPTLPSQMTPGTPRTSLSALRTSTRIGKLATPTPKESNNATHTPVRRQRNTPRTLIRNFLQAVETPQSIATQQPLHRRTSVLSQDATATNQLPEAHTPIQSISIMRVTPQSTTEQRIQPQPRLSTLPSSLLKASRTAATRSSLSRSSMETSSFHVSQLTDNLPSYDDSDPVEDDPRRLSNIEPQPMDSEEPQDWQYEQPDADWSREEEQEQEEEHFMEEQEDEEEEQEENSAVTQEESFHENTFRESRSSMTSVMADGFPDALRHIDQTHQQQQQPEDALAALRKKWMQQLKKQAPGSMPPPASRVHRGLPDMPAVLASQLFASLSSMRVSSDCMSMIAKASRDYFAQVSEDLAVYASHARRSDITEEDVRCLFKRQRHPLSADQLARQYLPREYLEELIPVAKAYNRLQ